MRASRVLPMCIRKRLTRTEIVYRPSEYAVESYSQTGEDVVLAGLMGVHQWHPGGWYVDVGAFHPSKHSNTKLFFTRGWQGINIDPSPAAIAAFDQERPGDTNLNIGISEDESAATYLEFSIPEHNGFEEAGCLTRAIAGGAVLVGKRQMELLRLETVLTEVLPQGVQIDLMSVDVEGMELSVLRSNDWSRYRPWHLIVEDTGNPYLGSVVKSQVSLFLRDHDYLPVARTQFSVIYKDSLSPRDRRTPVRGSGNSG